MLRDPRSERFARHTLTNCFTDPLQYNWPGISPLGCRARSDSSGTTRGVNYRELNSGRFGDAVARASTVSLRSVAATRAHYERDDDTSPRVTLCCILGGHERVASVSSRYLTSPPRGVPFGICALYAATLARTSPGSSPAGVTSKLARAAPGTRICRALRGCFEGLIGNTSEVTLARKSPQTPLVVQGTTRSAADARWKIVETSLVRAFAPHRSDPKVLRELQRRCLCYHAIRAGWGANTLKALALPSTPE